MIKITVFLTSFIALSAFAGAKKESLQNRQPSSSKVTLKAFPNKYLGWFVERTERGVIGVILSRIVPVTREASALLKNLDVNKTYQCDLTDSTFAGKYDEDLEGNFFVIDLTCK